MGTAKQLYDLHSKLSVTMCTPH